MNYLEIVLTAINGILGILITCVVGYAQYKKVKQLDNVNINNNFNTVIVYNKTIKNERDTSQKVYNTNDDNIIKLLFFLVIICLFVFSWIFCKYYVEIKIIVLICTLFIEFSYIILIIKNVIGNKLSIINTITWLSPTYVPIVERFVLARLDVKKEDITNIFSQCYKIGELVSNVIAEMLTGSSVTITGIFYYSSCFLGTLTILFSSLFLGIQVINQKESIISSYLKRIVAIVFFLFNLLSLITMWFY